MASFIVNISQLTLSRGLSFALGLVATPIVARLYLPEHFGIYGLVGAVATWVSAFATLGYYQALPMAQDRAENRALVRLCLWLTALLLIPITLIFGLGGGLVAEVMREPAIAPFLWFVPLLFLLDSLSSIADDALMKEGRFGVISLVTFLAINLERLLTILWALLLGASTLGLFMGNLLGVYVGTAIALGVLAVIFHRSRHPGLYRTPTIWEMAKKYAQFPKIQMWTNLLKVSAMRVPFFVLGFLFGPVTLGYFAFSRTIITLPQRLFGISVDQVFYPQAAQEWQESGSVTSTILKTVRVFSTVVVYPLLSLGLLAPLFFNILFGSRWDEAAVLCQLQSLWVFANILTTPFGNVFLIVRRAHLLLWYSAAQLAVSAATLLIGGWLGGARLAVALFSLGGSLVYGHMFVFCLHLGKVRARGVIWIFVKEILYAAAALAPPTTFYYLTHRRWLGLGLYLLCSLAYAALMLRREPKIKQRLLEILRRQVQHPAEEKQAAKPGD
ncbi:MAG: oligosaccharide flippase family protein [Thermodesulfobacteriota bacterium]